jgi:hypothetical protein
MKWLVRLAIVAVIVGLGLALISCDGGSSSTRLEQGQRVTAKEAWDFMQADIMEWKPGSKIIVARPPSRPGKEDLDTDGRSSAWRFIVAPEGDPLPGIYSLDTTAKPIKPNRTEQRRPVAQAIVDPDTWAIDSPEAMEIAVANGFETWVAEHPGFQMRTLTFELTATVEAGPHWIVEARDGADIFAILINAEDGSVIQ